MKVCKLAVCGAVALMLLTSCGDPDTTDDRGYTKAPLEDPSVLVRGETPGEMSRYGAPNRVVADVIELPEQEAPAQAQQPVAQVELPPGVTQEMVAQGDEIFNRGSTCFSCHGAAGAGGPLAPALNDGAWLHIDGSFDEIVRIILEGVPTPQQFPAPMPPLGGAQLTEDQVRQVAAWIYAISR